jgi:hypothetical protein
MGEHRAYHNNNRTIRNNLLDVPMEQPLEVLVGEAADFLPKTDEVDRGVFGRAARDALDDPVYCEVELQELREEAVGEAAGGWVLF